ncbi:DJ-1/PfpI family protein [Nonomuraea rhizosphaerae]|uniref:DJ-1/PfpI family protein n=1 Tax=Nonomuraea rhizosphaerae TaxID=2665663 RepID=UPI001C5FD0DC|nr:DJ-1/PfpI family protein [Nonomuraea rhizosphaerae]
MSTPRIREIGRFVRHYIEMVIAMLLGMVLLGMLWDAVLPEITRVDVDTLIMAADMTVGMGLWMLVRRHSWASIAEMSVAMVAPFLLLLVPYWFGLVSGHTVMMLGHVLMFVFMFLAMLRRPGEYTQHHHRTRPKGKWLWRTTVVLLALLLPAGVAAVNTSGTFGAQYTARADTVSAQPVRKAHDPAKPTVALLTNSKGTNVADLLGPYETLASTGRVNAYVVSPASRLVPLTGGLDLVPDLTFDELARLLADQRDTLDAVIVPALQQPGAAERDSINTWLRQQAAAGALTVSVCAGARTLAGSGLLDGHPATSHWLRMSGLRKDFPKVNWVSGVRYVDDGDVISTAGVLSGVEGALRVIERLLDVDTARKAAQAVHWRHYTPGVPGRIPVSSLRPADAVAIVNAAYRPSTIGVRLVEGTGELELASVFVTYTEESVVGRTVAIGDGPIRSAHGLTFVPRVTVAAASVDRLLVPGVAAARARAAGPGAEYLHTTEEFAFDPVLRDLARTYSVATARFGAKTLEYGVLDIKLTGSAWPWGATLLPVVLALLGAAAAVTGGAVFRRVRARSRANGEPVEAAAPELVRSGS